MIFLILFFDSAYSNNLLKENLYKKASNTHTYDHGFVFRENDPLRDFHKAIYHRNKNYLIRSITNDNKVLQHILSGDLIVQLYEKKLVDWFNVEQTYFDLLYKKAIPENPKTNPIDPNEISLLNNELSYLKNHLISYLSQLEIVEKEDIGEFLEQKLSQFKKITFLDFNYTETIKCYKNSKWLKSIGEIEIINIHGTLREENEIFGYGNDQDEKYLELKKLENDRLFDHFKTVEYKLDNNYDRFLEEIKSMDSFEVHIIGHSLGLTDKTLLQEVLDLDKCLRILLYKRSDLENKKKIQLSHFKENVIGATRIMNNEKNVRKKIVNFKKAPSFP